MKDHSSDVDAIARWRDRTERGGSDEARAAALVGDALALEGFPVELDDRRLSAIEERLKKERRAAKPPFWLRPTLVAALLIVSMATVMGYEAGWFAPLRERLRFRAIPPVAPEPVEHGKRRATQAETTPAHDPAPAPSDLAAAVVTAGEAAPQVSAPIAAHAPLAERVSVPRRRRLAVAETQPASPAVIEQPEPTPPSDEILALEQAMSLLRGKHDAPAALAALDDYLARFPGGQLAPEARVARVDALLTLDRAEEALRALEQLPLDAHRRSTELQVIRGELRARTDCDRGEADFTAVLARVRTAALEERALYGRAACRAKRGNVNGAADDLRRYVERFPHGAHVDWARRWLENARPERP
jgi:TolA-binding protein